MLHGRKDPVCRTDSLARPGRGRRGRREQAPGREAHAAVGPLGNSNSGDENSTNGESLYKMK